MRPTLFLLTLWLCLPLAGTSSFRSAPAHAQQVDYRRDVLPLFQQHCFRCHADEMQEGDLRLDSRAAIERGGHTGSPIVAESLEQSELYLRITSKTDGYRMPKEGPPLAAAEIDLLSRWIEQGAVYPASQQEPTAQTAQSGFPKSERSLIDGLGDVWNTSSDALELPSWQNLVRVIGLAVALILIYGLVQRFRSKRLGEPVQGIGWRWSLAATVVMALVAYATFMNGRVQELQSELRQTGRPQATPNKKPIDLVIRRDNVVVPPYPMHPSRLGGEYYRGNDERSPVLFNGGFYRTATLELHLIDADGNRLKRGDQVASPVSVELTIHRAPNATRELFSKNVFDSTHFRIFADEDQTDLHLTEIPLEMIEEEETWRVRVEVPVHRSGNADANASVASGMIYLFYGRQDLGDQKGRAHFGMRYDVKIDKGRIDDSSELWMGSMYNLNGRVLIPGSREILLDRWFDFRPIPINDRSISDPELLGLPEHQAITQPSTEH
ncbi:MAG: c-type cytochrome domain-containing protein [Planctomycetota bacterium]